jgi:hypothetical protein
MNVHTDTHNSHSAQQLTITLEILSEGSYEADLALVADVGRAMLEELEAAPHHRRSGPLLSPFEYPLKMKWQ